MGLEIDRYILRDVNNQFRAAYEKIADKDEKNKASGQAENTGAGGSLFAVGEVGTPDDIKDSLPEIENVPKPTTKKPSEATGTLIYGSLTVVPHTKYTLPC